MAWARRALIVGRRFTAARQGPDNNRSLNERSVRDSLLRGQSWDPFDRNASQ
jgi:hypothetical protein